MEYRALKGLPFESSRIGLGTWAMGGWMWGGSDEAGEHSHDPHGARPRHQFNRHLAPVYGFGRAEEIVGKAAVAEHGGARSRVARHEDGRPNGATAASRATPPRERILREVDHLAAAPAHRLHRPLSNFCTGPIRWSPLRKPRKRCSTSSRPAEFAPSA